MRNARVPDRKQKEEKEKLEEEKQWLSGGQ